MLALYSTHEQLCGRFLFPNTLGTPFSTLNILSDFCLLQNAWQSCKFSIADGCPPLLIGMMWSMTGDIGSGYLSFLSTNLPHIPHISCVIRIRFLALSNAVLCAPCLSALNGMASTSLIRRFCFITIIKHPANARCFILITFTYIHYIVSFCFYIIRCFTQSHHLSFVCF